DQPERPGGQLARHEQVPVGQGDIVLATHAGATRIDLVHRPPRRVQGDEPSTHVHDVHDVVRRPDIQGAGALAAFHDAHGAVVERQGQPPVDDHASSGATVEDGGVPRPEGGGIDLTHLAFGGDDVGDAVAHHELTGAVGAATPVELGDVEATDR